MLNDSISMIQIHIKTNHNMQSLIFMPRNINAAEVFLGTKAENCKWAGAINCRNKSNALHMKGFIIALLYGIISISITFSNKAVLSYYGFGFSNTLTLGQVVCTLVSIIVLRTIKLIPNEQLSIQDLVQCVPLAFCFVGMVVTGLAGLQYVNVPMFGSLRRGTTLIVMIGQYFILGKSTPCDEAVSIVFMVGGAILAGMGDITWSPFGYLSTFLNCLVTAGYLIYINKTTQDTKLDTFTLMLYNNVLSLPMVLVIVYVVEFNNLFEFSHWHDVGFQVCFVMSSVQAFVLNYLIFLCSTINSPLATSVTGQIKSILTTILGFFIFDDVIPTFLLLFGLNISTMASIWYSYLKYIQQIRAKEELPETVK